jgi:hypothetical protein
MATRTPKDKPTGDRPGNEPEVSPDAPAIPTFASLRARRRSSPVDLLMPEPAARVSGAAERAAPRPPDYVDLVRLGVHVAGALAALPVRVTLWAVREPMRLLRRLGRPLGHAPG